jgi:hypothetical protein
MRHGSAWLAAVAALAAGCGGGSLSGSLEQSMPLGFDRVELSADADALSVSYLQDTSTTPDIVFKLVVQLAGLDVSVPLDVDLSSRLEAGEPRASASRVVANQPVLFAPISMGTLRLDRDAVFKDRFDATFGLHFADDVSPKHQGLGLTVNGSFGGKTALLLNR